jgi:hypothetical protein
MFHDHHAGPAVTLASSAAAFVASANLTQVNQSVAAVAALGALLGGLSSLGRLVYDVLHKKPTPPEPVDADAHPSGPALPSGWQRPDKRTDRQR